MYIVRQNTSLSFWWRIERGRQDDWITINDNGVESVTHMYTEALLVLVHNVASFPLEFLRTIDVFIFVLDDQWCMILVDEEQDRHREDSLLHFYLFFFKTWKENELDFFCFSFLTITAGVFLFPYSETLLSIKLLIVFVYVDNMGECLSLIEQERRERRSLQLLLVVVWRTISS